MSTWVQNLDRVSLVVADFDVGGTAVCVAKSLVYRVDLVVIVAIGLNIFVSSLGDGHVFDLQEL
jgi:hypothetical protein